MKHLGPEHAERLRELLASIELDILDSDQELMLLHLDWVLDWNQRINLTAITDPHEAVRLHIVDSLLSLNAVRSSTEGRLCDIGSGAGFPGIPLAIAARRHTTIVESVGKKARVVAEFVAAELEPRGFAVDVASLRAEEYALSSTTQASVVTARALSQLGALIELASPLLETGGQLIALKGAISDAEIEAAEIVSSLAGMKIVSRVEYSLPEKHESRTLVTVRKESEPQVRLPRRPGMAQRDPLSPVPR